MLDILKRMDDLQGITYNDMKVGVDKSSHWLPPTLRETCPNANIAMPLSMTGIQGGILSEEIEEGWRGGGRGENSGVQVD